MVLLGSGCGQRGAGCRGKRLLGGRTERERGRERKESHEESRPSGFSVAESSVNGVQADWEKHEMDTWEGKGS